MASPMATFACCFAAKAKVLRMICICIYLSSPRGLTQVHGHTMNLDSEEVVLSLIVGKKQFIRLFTYNTKSVREHCSPGVMSQSLLPHIQPVTHDQALGLEGTMSSLPLVALFSALSRALSTHMLDFDRH